MTYPSSRMALISRRTVASSLIALPIWLAPRRTSARQAADVSNILAAAGRRFADVQTLHFALDVTGETFIDTEGAIQLQSAEGDLARPDRVTVEFKVRLLGATTVSIRMVTIGAQSWTTDLITGNWGDAPPEFGYHPAVLYDEESGLGPLMTKLEDPALAGAEEVDGRNAHHVSGRASAEAIVDVTAGTMTGDEATIDLWIDVDTFDLLRLRVAETASAAKDDPAIWELTLSAFDDTVTIEPPD